ncbi:PREDICTED: cytochrome P450 82A2-like [Lupinus angustifolius]|uniref:cytochrome P450 82A2-like n=1 Tax=Lupinus angustifolius TaxID=3871 RepID=UPI00092F018D|nr:PREDICTED: cytochrome P450 82A2-like [Lupinus angustifolius]
MAEKELSDSEGIETYEISNLELSDTDVALTVITKNDQQPSSDNWYLDIGFSNHMTRHKEWFLALDSLVKTKVKFADDSFITTEGIGKIMIRRKDGKVSYISNVLYVPKMKNNLISLGQLLEKGYYMRLEDRMMKIYNKKKIPILKAPLSHNRTFKIDIHIGDTKSLESIVVDTWIWHQSFGHLNFRSLESMSRFLANDESGKSKIDVRGQYYQLLPFGSGRRSCPGASLALLVIQATLASLVQCFDWVVNDGKNNEIDMSEEGRVTVFLAKPLKCKPVPHFVPFSN